MDDMERFRMWSGHFQSHLFFQRPNTVHWACLLQLTLLWKFSWKQPWCGLGAAKRERIRNSWGQKSQTRKVREAAKSVFVHFMLSQIEGIWFWGNGYEQYLPTSVNTEEIWVSFSALSECSPFAKQPQSCSPWRTALRTLQTQVPTR